MSEEELPRPRWSGAFAWYLENVDPEPIPLRFYELRPPKSRAEANLSSLENLYAAVPRSLEIWRDGDETKIVFGCEDTSPLVFYRRTYPGIEISPAKETEPSFVRSITDEHPPIAFDVELNHGLPFVRYARSFDLMNNLISALEPGNWIQIVFSAWDWTNYAETVGMRMGNLAEVMRQLAPGSTMATIGPEIAREFLEKSHGIPIILHIRGLLLRPNQTLATVLSNIKMDYDNAFPIAYDDPSFIRWLRTRAIPDPERFLEILADAFSSDGVRPWGKGREFIPVFCLTSSELPIFTHMPTEPSLPVKFAGVGGPSRVRGARGKTDARIAR